MHPDARSPEPHHFVVTGEELELILDGLHAIEYWDYATELDLPRRNGQVFLPEDDPTCWQHMPVGADEENAIEQIRRVREPSSRSRPGVLGRPRPSGWVAER